MVTKADGIDVKARVNRSAVLSALRTTACVMVLDTRRNAALSAAWQRLADLIDAASMDGRIMVTAAPRMPLGPDLVARYRASWDALARDVGTELVVAEGDAGRSGSKVFERVGRKDRALWDARVDAIGAQLDLIEWIGGLRG